MGRLRIWPFPAAILAGLAACDRLAGTEVGNPEVTVAARFAIHDTDASVSVPRMNLKVMGMGWSSPLYQFSIWNDADGHMVDFASDDSTVLPSAAMQDADWSRAELTLQAPGGGLALPDSLGFSEWSNPRYIKLVKAVGTDTVRALFQLEAGMRIKLGFMPTTIAAWRSRGKIMVSVRFDAGKWAADLGADPAFAYRQDGKHARYIMIAPGENAAAYAALKAKLPACFMADSAAMQ